MPLTSVSVHPPPKFKVFHSGSPISPAAAIPQYGHPISIAMMNLSTLSDNIDVATLVALMTQCMAIFVALCYISRANARAAEHPEQENVQCDYHSPTVEAAQAVSSCAAKSLADDWEMRANNVQCDGASPTLEAKALSSFAPPPQAPLDQQEQGNVQGDSHSEGPAAPISSDWFTSILRVSGDLSYVKAAARSLKKHGFLKKDNDTQFPLSGHWETEHGMTVTIDGKLVRWSQKRASRLKFHGAQKRLCSLSLYGDNTTGQLVLPIAPETRKMVQWSNGDVWQSHDGCKLDWTLLLSQTMTKVQREAQQDEAIRSAAAATLRLASKNGLSLLPECLMHVEQFVGSTTYYFDVEFESKEWNPWMLLDFSTSLGDSLPHLKVQHRSGIAC